MRRLFVLVALAAAVAVVVFWISFTGAGEYHRGGYLLCSDCHTMHYSQQHEYGGTSGQGFPPLSGGPTPYLLRQPEDQLCQACHDGRTDAPDVVGDHANGYVRQAGALPTGTSPREDWKGHTLDSTVTDAPGFSGNLNPGEPSTLTCISCHHQHGYNSANPAGNPYRNLKGKPGSSPGVFVSYVIGTTPDNSKDVRINIDQASYTPGSGQAATFGPYYSFGNTLFNEPDPTKSKYAEFCAGCHGNFHGKPGDTNIGGETGIEFIRHPTAGVDIGAVGGGHSNLGRYTGATSKVQVLVTETDRTAGTYTSATPSCMSCHKAHGNKNPFGLIFLARTEGSPNEEGSTVTDWKVGLRNLCGQCHVQGN